MYLYVIEKICQINMESWNKEGIEYLYENSHVKVC